MLHGMALGEAIMHWAPVLIRGPVLQADGRIPFMQSPFWNSRFCGKHQSDGTPRCCACCRLCPQV